MAITARQLALQALVRMQRDAAYSNLALDAALSRSRLPERDAALAAALVYGVQERLLTIDYQLALYLRQPLKKLRPEVLAALRLGVCQLLFMDKIPARAAVSESVLLVKQNGCAFAAGLVNAVLHKVEAAGLRLPDAQQGRDYALSVHYSFPEWLIHTWSNAYGREAALDILKACEAPAPLTIRVNTLRTSTLELTRLLKEEGVEARPVPGLMDALELERAGAVERLSAYRQGLFHVQDAASQLCCAAVGAQPGETVFDLCAAPGGKSFTLAQRMQGKGCVRSFDLYPSRTALITEGAQRLGLV